MTEPRAHIPLKVQLAAALLQLPDERGNPAIPHEHAKLMTADQIVSLFHRDHYPIRKADGGPDEPWNLHWRFIGAHRFKTATVDIPQMAKRDRIIAEQAAFVRRMLHKRPGKRRARKNTISSRPFQKRPKKTGRRGNARIDR